MTIMPEKRALAVLLLSTSTLVTLAGCTAARKTSAPVASGAEEASKKEYQWKDLSQGNAFYGSPQKPTPDN